MSHIKWHPERISHLAPDGMVCKVLSAVHGNVVGPLLEKLAYLQAVAMGVPLPLLGSGPMEVIFVVRAVLKEQTVRSVKFLGLCNL